MTAQAMNIRPVAVAQTEPRRGTRVAELEQQMEKLFRRLRMAVIYGGDKRIDGAVINQTGNPRSWKSYETVAKDIGDALGRIGCRQVSLFPEDMRLGSALKQEKTHLAWLNSGGVQGYSAVAHGPAMLEMFGIPYVGHDPLTAATLDNKHAFKRHLRAVGIPTSPFITWHPSLGKFDIERDRHFLEVFGWWDGEFIVKPVSGRASLNVHHVATADGLAEVVNHVYDLTKGHVLIEGYLPGREFCVAVCGPMIARKGRLERLDRPFTFAFIERVLEPGEKIFTSMDVKPITSDRMRLIDRFADADAVAQLEQLAQDVYTELSLETLVRLDVRADAMGRLHVLEANPKPDLKAPTATQTSIIAEGLDEAGLGYDDLVHSLLADRIDVLFSQGRGTADGLLALVR
jgi:D-alanine-D-alanine ligase